MSRTLRRTLALCAPLALLAGGCAEALFPDTRQTTAYPETGAALLIFDVYEPVTWIMLAIFVVVEALLLYAVLRYRRRPGQQGNPRQIHGNTALEIGWTIIPVVIVIAIAFPTLRNLWLLAEPPETRGQENLHVKVTGKQWWWQFDYPELGVSTANELHLPAGRTVVLHLTSDNVIHSFWVPRLSGKRDLVPGREQSIWFTTPEEPNVYYGQCAELCGASHALMRFLVFVDSPEEFDAWAERQKSPTVVESTMESPGPTAMMAGGCVACHKVDFEGSIFLQQLGPSLTHMGSRQTIAAGILDNTPENLRAWIRKPSAFKPGSLMPDHEWLTDEQVETIVTYLQSLK